MNERIRVIVGLGKTGLSCARYFNFLGEKFAVVDSRMNPPGLAQFRGEFPGVELVLGEFPAALLNNASELVVSPGVSLQIPAIRIAVELGVPVTGDIDIFSRAATAPVIAVTGSNGKSTVVSLLGAMAREAGIDAGVGGNLDGEAAAPALDLLRQGRHDLYILELSSFQLETCRRLNAEVAVILNISEDHMDRYESLAEYEDAKQRIFLGCGTAVFNRDDQASMPRSEIPAHLSSYGTDEAVNGMWGVLSENGANFLALGRQKIIAARELRIAGKHNVSNALAALALGDAIGLTHENMAAALREFPGLPHRCQWIRNYHGVDFYNDSKGTNVGAAVVAVESIGELVEGKIVLIAGGVDKESDFSVMLPIVKKFVKLAVLIGRDARKIANTFTGITETVFADSLADAVVVSARRASCGDAVVLSPACASFDMFTDFTHRGRVFTEAVEGLR